MDHHLHQQQQKQMTTPQRRRRRRRLTKKEKPKNRMALIDHFRTEEGDDNEAHSLKRSNRSPFQIKLKRVGLMMISGVLGKKIKSQETESDEVSCERSKKKSEQPSVALKKIVPSKVSFSFKGLFNARKQKGNGLRNGKAAAAAGVTPGKLLRVSSRVALQTMKFGGSLKRKSSFKKIVEEEELCRKRILLGGKCRPLNNTGTLRYDVDGFVLPDVI